MQEYVSETAEEFNNKLVRAERITNDEGLKLYAAERVKYEFDHYAGEVRLVFVKQTEFAGGKLTRRMLGPLVERLREVDKKWYVGIMLYGADKHRVKNETKVS